ncbi:hypothetical protein KAFR_0E03930 [Kazachstania africana CBS 2517]|uniref:Inositol phosphorylceramide synthase regulatory subunit KEI1 n=1 Tax=Kazachstania africana (strain ATCC 22294 / BCRC 22015 / CBS 2517 / CECT 1963 / NBRC 1671 / NRRL Y-8276) TaxID=1071382 RepID=H2AVZ4_KAZAF|nr:hypothetical protein KAFR_0E03930 [Kazachstania africana CBS 2517]CCF58544.1 hypothetical protein KAFR_0E03930 [Kazachstania africana CBS 2517]
MRTTSFSLPKSFLGVLPLYLAVEIVLGITAFNKVSGAFGILALFTGHPLAFMQWVFYLWSTVTLFVFAQGLFEIHKPNILTFSQIFVFYSIDTLCNCFFTLWFTGDWFNVESQTEAAVGSTITKRTEDISSQGASQGYEYSMTIFITLTSLVFRFYFNFILASFVQELLRHPKYMFDQDDIEQDLKNKSIWKRWWLKCQKSCYKLCKNLLA